MGLFGKERHGKVTTLEKGRRYVWSIPNMLNKCNVVYDSDLLDSFDGTSFHFHMIIGVGGDVGFYIHFKKTAIPKYSFYFQCGPHVMRQHTAHTIPKDTERCGHWNVCNLRDLKKLLARPEDPVEVYFCFDGDLLKKSAVPEEEGAQNIRWYLPNPLSRRLSPFTSHSFTYNGVFYVIRLDTMDEMEFTALIYGRSGLVPPHEIRLMTENDETLTLMPKQDNMTPQLLRFTRDMIEREIVIISITLYRGGNPLDVLDNPMPMDEQRTTQPGEQEETAKKYGPAMDDI